VKLRALVLALLTAAALVICTVRPAWAVPALWVVQSPTGTGKVYLFGTVHVLREGTQWRSPELDAAIAESQDLYLEIADPANMANVASVLLKMGFDRDHPLSTKISKADVALLDAGAKRYGFGSEAVFEPMRPWLAFMMLSALPALRSGYSSANGVDLQIRKDFVAAGKPIRGFETLDMQAHIFADLPESVQIALLEEQLKDMSQQTNVAKVDAMVNAWLAGNQDEIAASLQGDKVTYSPLYAKILIDRNKAWASALAERLKEPGTSFVSVGAGHLAGPDGVPALLARMGFTVTRVQEAQATPPPLSPAQQPPTSSAPQTTSSPAPTPTASPTPIPQTLTPPAGWKPRTISFALGGFKADRMWVDPNHGGAIMAGHIDMPGISSLDLDSLDALIHVGLAQVAGGKGAQPSTRVKICNGKQNGTYSKVTLTQPVAVKEDIVLAVSDRGYLAEYVRRQDVTDDPAALRSILTLCAP
jgi:uncharacterized protein